MYSEDSLQPQRYPSSLISASLFVSGPFILFLIISHRTWKLVAQCPAVTLETVMGKKGSFHDLFLNGDRNITGGGVLSLSGMDTWKISFNVTWGRSYPCIFLSMCRLSEFSSLDALSTCLLGWTFSFDTCLLSCFKQLLSSPILTANNWWS